MALISLRTNPKFRRLSRILKLPDAYVVGHLECMWHVAYNRVKGRVKAHFTDALEVEGAADWQGDDGALCAALVECRFLDEVDGGFDVHDLADHAPDFVKKKIKRSADKGGQSQAVADNGGQRRTTADNGQLEENSLAKPSQAEPSQDDTRTHDRDDTDAPAMPAHSERNADASRARKRAPIVDWREGPFGILWSQALSIYRDASSSIGGGPVARKAYDQAGQPDIGTLVEALKADAKAVRSNAAAKRVPDRLPMLSTWLNQGRWTAHEQPAKIVCPDCKGRGYIGDPRTPESARASGFRWCGRDACREAKARAEERAADSGFDHLFALRVANG